MGLKGSNFQGFDGGHPGDGIMKFDVCSLTPLRRLGLKVSNFQGLMGGGGGGGGGGGHPGMVIRKFGVVWSKTLPVGLPPPPSPKKNFFLFAVKTLWLNKPSHLLQLYKHIGQQNFAQTTSSSFS